MGSDTIWDISQPYFMYHKDVFWGSKFDKTSVASYAPSVGYAKEISVEKQKWIANALDNMKAISVRDESSYNLIKPFTKKEIEFTEEEFRRLFKENGAVTFTQADSKKWAKITEKSVPRGALLRKWA